MSWRRILLLSIVLVTVLGIVTWTLLQHSDVATELVRRELGELFRTRTTIASTRIELGAGRLSVEGLEVADPTRPDRCLIHVDRGHVEVQANALLGRLEPRLVVVEGMQIECGPTWPTLSSLLAPGADLATADPPQFPVVEVRSGGAVVHIDADERPLELGELQLTAAPLAADPTLLQVHGSARLREPSALLQLRGEVDLASGAASISLTTEDVTCSKDVLAWIARLCEIDRQGLDVGGELRSLQVSCTIPPSTAVDRTPVFVVAVDCRDVHLDAQDLPAIVEHASIQLRVDTAGHGSANAVLTQANDTGALEVTAQVLDLTAASTADGPTVELRASGRDVVVDEDVLAALRTFPVGREVVTALQPTAGRADVDLYLRDPHRSGGDAELDLTLRGVAMTFRGFGSPERRIGFPLPLVGASGRVRLRDGVLLLEDMSATIAEPAGGGTVTLSGRIETGHASGEDTALDIASDSIEFSDDLRQALSTLLRDDGDLYDRLAPSGRARVQVTVRPGKSLAGGFRVQIQPTHAAMQWAGFPYRLEDLQGSIVVLDEGVRFDLTGRHDSQRTTGGSLTMRGRIPLRGDHDVGEGFEAVIDVDQLVIDEDLRRAVLVVVPELALPWQQARPAGLVSGQVKVWRPQPDDELFHDVRLDLENVDIELPQAPWRALGLGGQVLVQGSGSTARIDFDALRGRLENGSTPPAQLALLGHIDSGPSRQRDLAFVVRDLELSEQLGRTLDQLGALEFETWTSLRPSGRVDLVCRERSAGGEAGDLQVVVQLVDVRSEAPMLPRPAEHMTGELRIEHGELTFRDVRGELGGALVRCWDGRVHQLPAPDNRTEISFAVYAKDFPVDDGLANLFSGPLGKAVLERELRGSADVDGLRLRFAVPSGNTERPFATTIQGQIGLDGVDMLLGTDRDGIRVLDLHGVVILDESTVTESGGRLIGTLRKGSLSLFGHPFEAMEASFAADAERLQLDTLTTRIHDGQLENARPGAPALTYLLPSTNVPEGRLAADLTFERVDVFSLLSASGWNNPPYSGSASGKVTLRRLDGSDVVGAEAEGTLRIERGDLGQVPLFTAIYAQMPAAVQPRFHFLNLGFRLTDQRVAFEDLEIRSDILAAKGSGTLDLDGYLDVRMVLDNLLGTSADPLVMPVIEWLTRGLVRIHLFGHLRDLRAEQRWLTEKAPRRRPVLPMPPERPQPQAPGF